MQQYNVYHSLWLGFPLSKSLNRSYTLDRNIICISAPGVPESIDHALGNHTRIILMVCDPIERAQVDYFEITSGVDNRHNEWRQKIEAV